MKTNKSLNHLGRLMACIWGLCTLASCGNGDTESTHDLSDDYHGVQEYIAAHGHDTADYPIDNRDLTDVEWVGVDIDNHDFLVEAREPYMLHFSCNECHSKPLDELRSELSPTAKKAHWDIHIDHADATTMSCATCHPSDNLDELQTLEGSRVSFNHSYKVCAQCHSTQFKDWQGGAHGKRLGGWTKPRIAKTCVGCHNPHKPAFESRWPARLNTQQILKEQELETTD